MSQWTHEEKSAVWHKATLVEGQDKNAWRKDQCGAWISWAQHGNRKSKYGWEIDHITPLSKGGTNAIGNLRPLQWENNAYKSNGNLVCVVKSSGIDNVKI